MKRFILSAFIAKVSANCEAGWLFDGVDKCHKVLPNKATWDGAKTACTDAGASLAVPTHYGVSDGVFRVQSSDRVWLGIEKSGDRWVDTSGNPVPFTQWYGNQPDNYMGRGENCVELSNGGGFYLGHYASGWNDESCSTMLNPLCEKDCINCSRPNACPAGWTQDYNLKNDAVGSNCYKVSTAEKTWGEANCACAAEGAHLAQINADMNPFYEHLLRANPTLWIGYREINGKWQSEVDKSAMSFSNWYGDKNGPFGDNFAGAIENCVHLLDIGTETPWWFIFSVPDFPFYGGWDDMNCQETSPYVCQRPLDSNGEALNCTIFVDSSALPTFTFTIISLLFTLLVL